MAGINPALERDRYIKKKTTGVDDYPEQTQAEKVRAAILKMLNAQNDQAGIKRRD